jgi:hypothetical protein
VRIRHGDRPASPPSEGMTGGWNGVILPRIYPHDTVLL